MSTAEKKYHYSLPEYLDIEQKSEFKSEYHNGEIFDMSGGTPEHSQIILNIGSELRAGLRGKNCRAYDSNLKIHIEEANSVVYPDAMAVCGDLEFLPGRRDIILNPTLVIEVLSEGTYQYDRGSKFRKYLSIPSLREFVFVEQDFPSVDVYSRRESGEWSFANYSDLNSSVVLPHLGIEIPLHEIYYQVEFTSPA